MWTGPTSKSQLDTNEIVTVESQYVGPVCPRSP